MGNEAREVVIAFLRALCEKSASHRKAGARHLGGVIFLQFGQRPADQIRDAKFFKNAGDFECDGDGVILHG